MNKSLLFFSLMSVAFASAQSKLAGLPQATHTGGTSHVRPAATVNMLQRSTLQTTLTDPKKSEYTRVPLGQKAQSVYSASIFNNNADPVTGTLRLRIFDPSMTQVAIATSAPESINGMSGSSTLTVTPVFTPTSAGVYTFTYDAIIDGLPDAASAITYSVQFTDGEMARDDNTFVYGLGIGSGEGGYLGNSFTFSNAASLASVDIYQSSPAAGDIEIGCAIFKIVSGEPQLVYTAPSQVHSMGAAAAWFNYEVNPPLAIEAGDTLVVCAQEFAQGLQVGLTTDIFTTGSTYIKFPSSPISGWAHNEDFGGSYAKTYMIRTNLICNLAEPTVNNTQQVCEGAVVSDLTATGTGIQWFADAVGGTALDGTTALATGTYYVSQTDGICTSNRAAVSVTVNPLTQNTTVVNACDQYTWAVNGSTYTASGSYDVTVGCHTETLELTISSSANLIATQPSSVTVAAGDPAVFTVSAPGATSYKWQTSSNGNSWTSLNDVMFGVSGSLTNTLTLSSALTCCYNVNGVFFRVIVSNGGCDVDSNAVVLSVTLGLDDVNRNKTQLYPNPTSGLVHIATNTGSANVSVTDVNGRVVCTKQLMGEYGDIDISNAQAGVYLFTISTQDVVTHRKVIKQ